VPPIMYDGITTETLDDKVMTSATIGLCVGSGQGDVANLDAARKFKNLERNPVGFDCQEEKNTSSF